MNRARFIAWALGGGAAATCVIAGVVCVVLDVPRSFLLDFLDGFIGALLGALIASRQPRNAIGWLMIAFGWLASLFQVIAGYGYAALAVHGGAWPLGSIAAWVGAWIWVPAIGFIAVIAARFPNGHGGRFGRFVDGLYVLGTALFVIAIAFASPKVELSNNALPGNLLNHEFPNFQDPVALRIPSDIGLVLEGLAITSILSISVLAAVALILRYRRTKRDERLQIKWFAYAGALCAAAVVYGGLATFLFGQPLYLSFVPLELVAISIPATIGIAVLRYRLYEIDLIINRTLVYGGLTAILAAVYAAVVALLNRVFISLSGQKSDAAYVVTAFVVVIAASPMKDWLQRQVDRRVRHASPAGVLGGFRASVDAVVSVMDVSRLAHTFLDQAMVAFDARAAELYLDSSQERPAYARGKLNGEAQVEVILGYEDRRFGRLVLGSRRGDIEYTQQDRELLQSSADAVGEALALGAQLGFKPVAGAEAASRTR